MPSKPSSSTTTTDFRRVDPALLDGSAGNCSTARAFSGGDPGVGQVVGLAAMPGRCRAPSRPPPSRRPPAASARWTLPDPATPIATARRPPVPSCSITARWRFPCSQVKSSSGSVATAAAIFPRVRAAVRSWRPRGARRRGPLLVPVQRRRDADLVAAVLAFRRRPRSAT